MIFRTFDGGLIDIQRRKYSSDRAYYDAISRARFGNYSEGEKLSRIGDFSKQSAKAAFTSTGQPYKSRFTVPSWITDYVFPS
jgi:hypothetical protein